MFHLFIQVFSYKQSESLLIQSMSIPSHSPTIHNCEELDSALVSTSGCKGAAAFPAWGHLCFRLNQPFPPQCLLTGCVLQPPVTTVALCWTSLSLSVSVLCWGTQNWGQCSSRGLRSAEQRGIIPFLSMLALHLLMQPRRLLAIFAARALLAHLIAH